MIAARVKSTIVIRRPVEDVFGVVGAGYFDYAQEFGSTSETKAVVEFPPGPVGVGSRGHIRSEDGQGFMIDSDVVVTEFVPPTRLVVDYITTYADEQPDKLLPMRYANSQTVMHSTYLFVPDMEGTVLSVELVYELGELGAGAIFIPAWSGRWQKQLDGRMVRLRDRLEIAAGLVPRKAPFRIRRSWIALGMYFVVLAGLLWVYGSREAIGLSREWVDALRTTLSAMIVGGVLLIVLTISFSRR
jgi:hypothetical protein